MNLLLDSAMAKKKIKLPDYVFEVPSKGKLYYYYQKHRGTSYAGPCIRIPGDPSTPEWWEEYRRVSNQPQPIVNPNTFEKRIAEWRASKHWRDKVGPGTSKDWIRYCNRIVSDWGDLDVRNLDLEAVEEFHEYWQGHSANNMVRCLSSFMSWAVKKRHADSNPCLELDRDLLKDGKGNKPWPWWAVERAREELPPYLWWAAGLAVYTGMRQSDILKLHWTDIDGNLIEIEPGKTQRFDKEITIGIHDELRALLDEIPRHDETILTNDRDKARWTKDGFKTSWRNFQPAFLKEHGLKFAGLRNTYIITGLELNATDAQVRSATAHSERMHKHYAEKINRRKMAMELAQKWNDRTK